MENNYLIPANTKKSQYYLGLFTLMELIMVGCAAIWLMLILLFVHLDNPILYLLLAFLPPFIVAFLVFPLPNYHNVLQLLVNIVSFYKNRRRYYWKGWSKDEELTRDSN